MALELMQTKRENDEHDATTLIWKLKVTLQQTPKHTFSATQDKVKCVESIFKTTTSVYVSALNTAAAGL